MDSAHVAALAAFVERHPRLLVLTGAGCSTGSGIPDYRGPDGVWKRPRPVQYADFVARADTRTRYWARSLVGWPRIAAARPNPAHRALARLESRGYVHTLITQNVDGLHQKAGSRRVLDLHGRLDRVECLDCGCAVAREDFQRVLALWNPGLEESPAEAAPDGDARVEPDAGSFAVPPCPSCGGNLKPRVVLFGESVPAWRVTAALGALAQADALLVVGSSLMVFSGYRFCLAAERLAKPIAAVNLGRTRADALLALKLESDCSAALTGVAERLAG
jgi:NAD-dependent SIR2 family protein deacetylase